MFAMPCYNCLVRLFHLHFHCTLTRYIVFLNIIDSSTFFNASCFSMRTIGVSCGEGVLSISQNFLRF